MPLPILLALLPKSWYDYPKMEYVQAEKGVPGGGFEQAVSTKRERV
jgi:hypothetical protein